MHGASVGNLVTVRGKTLVLISINKQFIIFHEYSMFSIFPIFFIFLSGFIHGGGGLYYRKGLGFVLIHGRKIILPIMVGLCTGGLLSEVYDIYCFI